MQERMQKAQEDLAKIEVTGEAGAGMVKVTMTCNHNVRRVDIDESLMDDDKDMIEDLVAAACNDAVRRVQETSKEKMAEVLSLIDTTEKYDDLKGADLVIEAVFEDKKLKKCCVPVQQI